ncbi:hypothetical protein Q7P37_007646 [Cladosporium fusiforme]
MGEHTGSRVANIILRFLELGSAAIVTGIVGWVLHRIDIGNGPSDGRLIYTEVVAVLGLVVSIVLLIPFKFVFKAWPVDLILFVMWLVAFGLLADLTGTEGCNSDWYLGYWGWYWSGLWFNPHGIVNTRACSQWRTVLAFSGTSWILFLLSASVGIYRYLSRDPYDHDTGDSRRNWVQPWKREKNVNGNMTESRTEGPVTSQMKDP